MSAEYIQQDQIDQLLRESDDTFMALPDIGLDPHLLISKVNEVNYVKQAKNNAKQL